MNKRRHIILIIFVAIFFFVLGWFVNNKTGRISVSNFENRLGADQFINPILECDNTESVELKSFEKDVNLLVDNIKKNQNIDDVSIYFRELNLGYWFGINMNIKFAPASLLKVPIMIAYYKEAEKNPDILKKELILDSLYEKQDQFFKTKELEIGKKYTIDYLIEKMIVDSDNNAKDLLTKNDKNHILTKKVYDDLGLENPFADSDYVLPIKEYSRLFRILYNASYINKEMSNKALKLLSRVKFKDGLIAGVPKDIVVSHKYGIREIETNTNNGVSEVNIFNAYFQLHDCGIVYEPSRPYLLCIMTKGNNINDLSNTIKKIADLIYNKVKNQ